MSFMRSSIALLALGAGIAVSTAAAAAPRVLFRGCAHYGVPPFCLMMKATDGKTYQLLEAGPAFPPGTRVLVYGTQVGDIGLCFAPTAKVIRFKVLPPGPC